MAATHVLIRPDNRLLARRFAQKVRIGATSIEVPREQPSLLFPDHSNTGNEAVLQCSSGNYCCDFNRLTPGCCDTTTTRFRLDALPVIAGMDSSPDNSNNAPTSSLLTTKHKSKFLSLSVHPRSQSLGESVCGC